MSPDKKVLARAIQLGHHLNPENRSNLTIDDVAKVDTKHPEAVKVLHSLQQFMVGDLDRFSLKDHGRLAIVDGDIGPSTYKLSAMQRCGHPDYGRAKMINGELYAVPDDVEEANWPRACRGELQFGRVFEKLPGATKEQTDMIWWATCNNWSQVLDDLAMFSRGFVDSITGLHIWAALKRLSGSTLAWSYLARDTCNTSLEQAYNLLVSQWPNLGFGAAVTSHEVGHAIGLPHNRDNDALMYPSIHSGSIARKGYPNQTDLAGCEALGYTLSGLEQLPDDELWYPRSDNPGPTDPPPPWPGPDNPANPITMVRLMSGGRILKDLKVTE